MAQPLSVSRKQQKAIESSTSPGAGSGKGAAGADAKGAKGGSSVASCRVIVVIDPGHGDRTTRGGGVLDSGAIGGPNKEYQEKNMALDVAKAFKSKLEARTDLIEAVYLTREGDTGDGTLTYLHWRTDFAVEKQAKIFVSLHMNSAGTTDAKGNEVVNTAAHGKEVWYWTGAAESQKLANSILAAYKLPLRDRHVQAKKFGVLRLKGTIKASALIEMGFIPNDGDRNAILNGKDTIAEQFTEGVCNYILANRAVLCG
jgi:N-acetylmuramoyl-L-alanine amidase